ncbi:signal peptidase I [Cellulophaga baltica]|uniref:signal peptidase I n=1 Tax=Cellulophaga TaxID=104264 RepID=UPI001C06EF51|nr:MULTISPECIES: signal peptidase I [Cellulophaga]MBU2996495.1 signal peptidase I [Cellulophaga baltica]MDO6767888.1 signal peptidase I [Cellulophaga sp. 1_MG-2023]
MSIAQWLIFILVIQVIHFLGTWKLYVKAGRKSWEAIVPIYNAIVLMKIINRPTWWVILLFIPIINLLMFPVVWVETIRSFGRNSLTDTWLVLLTLGFYTYYVNYALDVEHIKERSLQPTTMAGEWVSSIVFAVVAASIVHTYFVQPYVIPTSSLEKTLLVGDFLFVSKFHYGARTPMTTVAAPMVHDTIPGLGIKSYLKKPQLPYFRLPGFKKVKKNDIVVFSWPADTVYQFYKKQKGVIKPIDKKSNYVKRCVGTPGDSLAVKNGDVYINGEKLVLSDRAKPEFIHTITTKNDIDNNIIQLVGRETYSGGVIKIPKEALLQDKADEILETRTSLEFIKSDSLYNYYTGGISDNKVISFLKATNVKNMALFNMTEQEAENLVGKSGIVSVDRFSYKKPSTDVFPQDKNLQGTSDNFGPIYLPQAGETIKLNLGTLPYYKKIIKDYEHNTLTVAGNQIKINNQITDTYTFKQGYYWMMGDNRHRSEDSRVWGYVPEDHIVGTPVFIWMSIDHFTEGIGNWKIRWDRVFTTVNGEGEPTSYFKYFLILLVGYFVFDYFRKKKKSKEE